MSRSKHDFRHTPESDQRIRDGYSATEPVQSIADALGVTRNVVIGRARRIGLAGTYDAQVVRQRIGDAHRGMKHKSGPRPKMRAWWASLSSDDRAAHVAKMAAARRPPAPLSMQEGA